MTTMQALVLNLHGGAGGVGFVAVQLARALDATVAASARDLELVAQRAPRRSSTVRRRSNTMCSR